MATDIRTTANRTTRKMKIRLDKKKLKQITNMTSIIIIIIFIIKFYFWLFYFLLITGYQFTRRNFFSCTENDIFLGK